MNKPPPRIEPWEVYHKLKSVKVGKAGGPDMIPPRLIKEFACELSVPLSHIYSESLAEGTSPPEWKKAVVIPVPKTTPAVIDKLRPISLTDIFAKIFESFVAKWTLKDLFPNLDKRQFGNVRGLSTSHYLIDLLHTLFMYAENNKSLSDLILTDFCKAFDRIDHNVALKKLISYQSTSRRCSLDNGLPFQQETVCALQGEYIGLGHPACRRTSGYTPRAHYLPHGHQ